MLQPSQIPIAGGKTMLKETLERMSAAKLGICSVVGDDNTLLGIFTDGDIRRMLLTHQKPFSALFVDDVILHATKKPATTSPKATLVQAVQVMEEKEIWDLPVVDEGGKLLGLLHLHPAIKALLGLS